MKEAANMLPDLMLALPELLLVVGAMILLMIGVYRGDRANQFVTGVSVALIVAAMILLMLFPKTGTIFNNAMIVDSFSQFMKMLALIGSGVAIAMSVNIVKAEKLAKFEYPVLILLATAGMMIMISANTLITLYLGIEMQSLSLYVLAAFNRDSSRATEAGLKYFVLGALSSGMLLYGMSLVYGFTGQIEYKAIATSIVHNEAGLGVTFGLVFMLAGLAFKISAVPFHMWTPDVYEGAPTPVTAFFAAAPKVAGLAVMIRILMVGFDPLMREWQEIIVFVAIMSMALGAFAAIGQRNIKRLMAYSSIGHMGYALVGLAAGSKAGIEGVIIYITVYLAMTLGTFACILTMRRKDGPVETIDDLAGLSQNNKPLALVLAALMFSLAGIPPLAGFFGKWFVFLAAIEAGLYPLAVLGVLSSVVGAFYYLRIVKIMFFDEPVQPFERIAPELKVVLIASGLFLFIFLMDVTWLTDAVAVAAKSLL